MTFPKSTTRLLTRAGCLLFVLLVSGTSAWSQKIGDRYEESGALLLEGIELHEKGSYESAIKKYKKISRNDSLYFLAAYELGLSYISHEEYDKAVELLSTVVYDKNNNFRKLSIKSLGDALDMAGKPDSARKVYEYGMNQFPYEYAYYYETGMTYQRQKQYARAIEYYKKTLRINSMHPASHLQIGLLAVAAKKPALALMALETYVILNTSSSNVIPVISMMEQSSTNEYEDDTTFKNIPPDLFDFASSLEDVDAVLLSKAALSVKYKAQIKLNYKILKQLQVLCEKVPQGGTNDWLLDFYTNFYHDMLKEKMYKGAVLFSISGINAPAIQSEVKKNKKAIDAFKPWALEYFEKIRKDGNIPSPDGATGHTHFFDASGNIQAVGDESSDGKKQNFWVFYHDNGVKSAEGSFKNGVKTGTWKYYYETGVMKSYQTFKDGEKLHGPYMSYYGNGSEEQQIEYKDGLVDGEVVMYNPNRSPHLRLNFTKDKLNGMRINYDEHGFKTSEVKDVGGIYQGTYRTFNEDGSTELEVKVVNGKINGKAVYKDMNGKVIIDGAFTDGDRSGEWIWYYPATGNVSSRGEYVKGKQNGVWKYYYEDGKTLKAEETYVGDLLTGPSKNYDENGKVYKEVTFKAGKIESFKFFAADGKVIDQGAVKKGSINFVNYYSTRAKLSEGLIKDGKLEGPWKFYFMNGALETETTYKNDEKEGIEKDYYANGKLHYELPFDEGKRQGFYKSYHKNGAVKSEGFYKDNKQHGEWRHYYANGKIKTIEYYYADENMGYIYHYQADGKISSKEDYRAGFYSGSTEYDTAGKVINEFSLDAGNGYAKFKSLNKKPYYEGKFVNAYKDSVFTSWHPNGKKRMIQTYRFAKQHGPYKVYFDNGNISIEGNYKEGKQDSIWKYYYESGKVSRTVVFRDGDYHGTYRSFYPDGKPETETEYRYDEKHGISKLYGPDGVLTAQMVYEAGVIKSYTYLDKSSQLLPPIVVTNATGTVKTFYPNGNPALSFTLDHGYYNGKYTMYYTNGKIANEWNYVGHEAEGERKQYYSSGQLKKVETYFYDELNGIMKQYNEAGKLISETPYLDGDKHGYQITYDNNGKQTKKVLYLYGLAYE